MTSASIPSIAPSINPNLPNSTDKSSPNSNNSDNSLSSQRPESPLTKKANYYFFKSTPAEEFEKYKPQKIDDSIVKQEQTNNAGGSKWNVAGTWEERDLTKWAHQRLKDILLSVSSDSTKITSASVSGDATVVFSRGKKKYGIDLSVNAEWISINPSEKDKDKKKEIKGKVILPAIDDTCDGEYEIQFTSETNSAEAEAALRQMKKQRDRITQLLDSFIEEFKQQ